MGKYSYRYVGEGGFMNVIDAIRIRRSVRQYDPRPIPDEVMQRMKDALRLAPSACNKQPWKFVIVSDPDMKKRIAQAANGQRFIAEAPVIVIGVGFPDLAYKGMGGHGNSVDIDLAIALDHLTLAAAAEGLGTCWIGSFSEEQVKKLIGAPRGSKLIHHSMLHRVIAKLKKLIGAPLASKIVAMTPLGYPANPNLIHPIDENKRKPVDELFAYEKYY